MTLTPAEHYAEADRQLDRITALIRRIGDPDDKEPDVILLRRDLTNSREQLNTQIAIAQVHATLALAQQLVPRQ